MTMVQEPADASAYEEQIELLNRVLSPLGEEALRELRALLIRYLDTVSPITWCSGHTETGEALEAVIWEIGKPSPLDETRTVFALFDFPPEQCVIAYSVTAVQEQGQEGAIGFYFREKIYRPRYATGPLSLKALFNDLAFHLDIDDDPEPQKLSRNGA